MPKYQVTGQDKHGKPHTEVVDTLDPKTAITIAHGRGISKHNKVIVTQIDGDQAGEIVAQEAGDPYADFVSVGTSFSDESRLHRAPISTIAMGVFLGLCLFGMLSLMIQIVFFGLSR